MNISEEDIQKELKLQKLRATGAPERYWDPETYESLEQKPWNVRGFKAVEAFVEGRINGILFTGRAGTGKTILACKAMYYSEWDTAKFESVPRLLTKLKDGFNSKQAPANLSIVKDLKRHDILVLDDLGAEKTSDWTAEVLYLIINERYEANKKLIVTTNCKPSELSQRLGDRVLSRLAEMCVLVKFETDEDFRLKNWANQSF